MEIRGTGSYLPGKIITNDDLSEVVDTNDEWISSRTGICQRHISEGETTSEMAAKAAVAALEDAEVSPEEVELIIVATMTGDEAMPGTACKVQKEIGAVHAACFDLSAACTGFVFALNTANAYLASGMYRNALVIGADMVSKVIDWTDRATCVLFGDGAGAVVLTCTDKKGYRFISHSDGSMGNALMLEHHYDRNLETEQHRLSIEQSASSKVSMDGQAVFRFAVRRVPQVIEEVLCVNGLSREEIDCYVLHQANQRIVEAVAKRLKEPLGKFPMNLQNYGNTSSASIPILLNELDQSKRLKTGDRIVMAGFGGGLTWGASYIEL